MRTKTNTARFTITNKATKTVMETGESVDIETGRKTAKELLHQQAVLQCGIAISKLNNNRIRRKRKNTRLANNLVGRFKSNYLITVKPV